MHIHVYSNVYIHTHMYRYIQKYVFCIGTHMFIHIYTLNLHKFVWLCKESDVQSILYFVAGCIVLLFESVLQCFVRRWSMMHYVAVYCRELKCVVVHAYTLCFRVFTRVAAYCSTFQFIAVYYRALQGVLIVCNGILQCVAVRRSVLQCAHIQMFTRQTIQTVLVVRDKIVIQAKRESCYKEYCTHNLGEKKQK